MAYDGPRSPALILLFVNLVLYFIVIAIAAWAVNHGIQRSRETGDKHYIYSIGLHPTAYVVHLISNNM